MKDIYERSYSELKQMEISLKELLTKLPEMKSQGMTSESTPVIVFGDTVSRANIYKIAQIKYINTIGGYQYCIKSVQMHGLSTIAYCLSVEECAEIAVDFVSARLRKMKMPELASKYSIEYPTLDWYVDAECTNEKFLKLM